MGDEDGSPRTKKLLPDSTGRRVSQLGGIGARQAGDRRLRHGHQHVGSFGHAADGVQPVMLRQELPQLVVALQSGQETRDDRSLPGRRERQLETVAADGGAQAGRRHRLERLDGKDGRDRGVEPRVGKIARPRDKDERASLLGDEIVQVVFLRPGEDVGRNVAEHHDIETEETLTRRRVSFREAVVRCGRDQTDLDVDVLIASPGLLQVPPLPPR